MERCLQICDSPRRPVRNGDGDCRFAGLERNRRPWVPPSQGMKKYVWSETVVEGGKPFTGKLAHPPSNTGAFQNMGVREEFGRPPATPPPTFYADAAVVAFRVPAGESDDAAQV